MADQCDIAFLCVVLDSFILPLHDYIESIHNKTANEDPTSSGK
jgi:hypothetical protein